MNNQIVIPGIIDAHSHLVFGGNRVNEYSMKIKGASYMDIYNAGGGIHSTVKATRNTSFEDLYKKAVKTLIGWKEGALFMTVVPSQKSNLHLPVQSHPALCHMEE